MACAAAAGLSLPPLPGPFARERWLGRVVNARAEPIDGQGPLPPGPAVYPYRASPPPAHSGVGLATRWISGCVRSTPSSPSAAASGWASSRGPRRCRPCALGRRAIAEYFRDLGKYVLVLMDSVTRFAMAQREIGLSAGEPPTAKGYTPTVFVELPRLLERAGPGT